MRMRFGVGVGFGLGMAVGGLSGHAQAQPAPSGSARPAAVATVPKAAASAAPAPSAPAAPAGSAPAAVSAPDIVRLKNGGILRGTISELVPGESVTLVLITGETRKVPYSDVQYAGAANADPGNQAPAVATAAPVAPAAAAAAVNVSPTNGSKASETRPFAVVHAKESDVTVVSSPENVTLFRRSAIAGAYGVGTISGYDEVCTAPCNVSMPAGTHTFAIAKAGRKPIEGNAVTLPAGKTTLRAEVEDRTALRVGAGVIGLAATIGGFVLIAKNAGDVDQSAGSIAAPLVLAGVGGGLIGLAFVIPDGATISVGDGSAPLPSPTPAKQAAPPVDVVGSNSSPWLDQRSHDAGSLRNRLSGLTITAHF